MQQIDAAQKYYGLFNRDVNTAVTGVLTKQHWEVQVNLKGKGGSNSDLHKQHAGDDQHDQCIGVQQPCGRQQRRRAAGVHAEQVCPGSRVVGLTKDHAGAAQRTIAGSCLWN
ncbi:TPA: hypothetical protein ACH3X1_007926 [Trebouxia sp. C0004]